MLGESWAKTMSVDSESTIDIFSANARFSVHPTESTIGKDNVSGGFRVYIHRVKMFLAWGEPVFGEGLRMVSKEPSLNNGLRMVIERSLNNVRTVSKLRKNSQNGGSGVSPAG